MTTPRIRAALTAAALLVVLAPVPAAQAAPSAVPGLERLSMTVQADESGASTSVNCPFPKTVTGAGAELLGARGQAGVTEYSHAERQWGFASASEDDDGFANPWTLTAYVICADGPHREWAFSQTPSDSVANKSTTVTCPAGTLLTGGGASLIGPGTDLVLDDVVPSADLRSLRVEGFEDQDGTTATWLIASSARCGAPLPGQRRVSATSASNSVTSKSVTATCPAGQRVIGTGSEIVNGRGQVLLDDVVPSADLTNVRVEAFEDQDGTAANWTVTAHAICADQ